MGRRTSASRPPARLRPDVVRLVVDDHLILGCEQTGALLRFDPLSSVVVDSFDGTTDLEEVVADLSDAAEIPPDAAVSIVDGLVDALLTDGIIEGEPHARLLPRHPYPPVPADSCLGRRMGLSRTSSTEIWGYGQPFRVRSTLPEALEGVTGLEDPPDGAPAGMETFTLRATRPGRVARRQQLFNSVGHPWHVAHDLDAAVEALLRTVQGRMELSNGGAWIEGAVLSHSEGVALIHPGIAPAALNAESELKRRGLRFVPGALCELVDECWLRVPAPVTGPDAERRLPITSVLLPNPLSELAGNVRELLTIARCWDQVHFDALGAVGRSVQYIAIHPQEDVVNQLTAAYL